LFVCHAKANPSSRHEGVLFIEVDLPMVNAEENVHVGCVPGQDMPPAVQLEQRGQKDRKVGP